MGITIAHVFFNIDFLSLSVFADFHGYSYDIRVQSTKPSSLFNTPILLLIFNRPDYVKKQLQHLRKLSPKALYIAADGPRIGNKTDAIDCRNAREMLSLIDWECEIKTHFVQENLGCRLAVSTAIDWFFKYVVQGIIVEDDCIADLSFFTYCQEMLEKYKDNTKIMHISGFNPLMHATFSTSFSYSIYPFCWGWATWRRAWNTYDVKMSDWSTKRKEYFLESVFNENSAIVYWKKLFDKMYKDKIDTWDYQWVYAILKEKGLCIFPKNNLVSNIGFDKRATHTWIPFSPQAHRQTQSMEFPLQYPEIVEQNVRLDTEIEKEFEKTPLIKIVQGLKQYFSHS